MMYVTRNFKQLVQRWVASDAEFGAALLREGIDTMLAGDVDTDKAIPRDYLKAPIGFEKLGGDRHVAEEPDPHVRAAREPAGKKSLQRARLSAEVGRPATACDVGAGLR
jgi:hypothetical protein